MAVQQGTLSAVLERTPISLGDCGVARTVDKDHEARGCVAHQAPLSMVFLRQEYWSGLPRPPPGDLPDQGIEPESLMSPTLAGGFFTAGTLRPESEMERTPEVPASIQDEALFDCTKPSCSSVAQSCPTLCDPMNRSTPGLPVHHQPLEFT